MRRIMTTLIYGCASRHSILAPYGSMDNDGCVHFAAKAIRVVKASLSAPPPTMLGAAPESRTIAALDDIQWDLRTDEGLGRPETHTISSSSEGKYVRLSYGVESGRACPFMTLPTTLKSASSSLDRITSCMSVCVFSSRTRCSCKCSSLASMAVILSSRLARRCSLDTSATSGCVFGGSGTRCLHWTRGCVPTCNLSPLSKMSSRSLTPFAEHIGHMKSPCMIRVSMPKVALSAYTKEHTSSHPAVPFGLWEWLAALMTVNE